MTTTSPLGWAKLLEAKRAETEARRLANGTARARQLRQEHADSRVNSVVRSGLSQRNRV